MAQDEATLEEPPVKSGKKGLIIGVVLALAAGGGGFFAVSSGMILAPEDESHAADHPAEIVDPDLPDVAFIPLEPITVSLPPGMGSKHLRFRAELEVPQADRRLVEEMTPRVIDVLNSYLRAIEPSVLQETGVLTRLRSQMLRRVQLVVGEGRVRDLLVMEFVFT